MMEEIQEMKKKLIEYVWIRMSDLENMNTSELGEAIDMIKDLSEAAYYCSMTK